MVEGFFHVITCFFFSQHRKWIKFRNKLPSLPEIMVWDFIFRYALAPNRCRMQQLDYKTPDISFETCHHFFVDRLKFSCTRRFVALFEIASLSSIVT